MLCGRWVILTWILRCRDKDLDTDSFLAGDSRKYWQRSGEKVTGIKGKPLQMCREESAPSNLGTMPQMASKPLEAGASHPEGKETGVFLHQHSLYHWLTAAAKHISTKEFEPGFCTEHRAERRQSGSQGVPQNSGCWGRDDQNSSSICCSIPEPPPWPNTVGNEGWEFGHRILTCVIVSLLVFCLPSDTEFYMHFSRVFHFTCRIACK